MRARGSLLATLGVLFALVGLDVASADPTFVGRGIQRVLINGVRQPSGVSEIQCVGSSSACYRDGGVVTFDMSAAGGGGGHVIQDEGSDLPQGTYLDCSGSGIACTNVDGGVDGGVTRVTVNQGYATVSITDAGTYAQRGKIEYVPGGGTTIAGSDSSGDNTTYLTVSQLGVTTSFECSVQTTNGTATLCGNIPLATSNANYVLDGRCTGLQSDYTNGAGYLWSMSARNNAGTVSGNGGFALYGTHESNASWTVATAAPSGTNLPLNVTGAAGATVNWRCYVMITQQ